MMTLLLVIRITFNTKLVVSIGVFLPHLVCLSNKLSTEGKKSDQFTSRQETADGSNNNTVETGNFMRKLENGNL